MNTEFDNTLDKISPGLMQKLAIHWISGVALEYITHQQTGQHFQLLHEDNADLCIKFQYTHPYLFENCMHIAAGRTGVSFDYLMKIFWEDDEGLEDENS